MFKNVHGVGLRPTHYNEILKTSPDIGWFEVIAENYMDTYGKPRRVLESVRENYPIAMHGVSLSIGSTDTFSKEYLDRWKLLIDQIDPFLISDHLCWTHIKNHNSHDLLPLPFTREAAKHIIERIDFVQTFLKRDISIENISSYVVFRHSEMTEWEFIAFIAKQSGCKILLDINNIFVNSVNFNFDPMTYLNNVPKHLVSQIHLAGHTDMGTFLFDTHDCHVAPKVWDLYAIAVDRFGSIPTLIEWDDQIPSLEVLLKESKKAKFIMKTRLTPRSHALAS
ncbi:MAG: DUF692 domain-containing protein [Bdellovibrionales bacterium]|nr:DUF692 domain-containing protein [Bdellovibrionales bacterium]